MKGKYLFQFPSQQQGVSAANDLYEMAKDEARHGAGFKGLLKRYFG